MWWHVMWFYSCWNVMNIKLWQRHNDDTFTSMQLCCWVSVISPSACILSTWEPCCQIFYILLAFLRILQLNKPKAHHTIWLHGIVSFPFYPHFFSLSSFVASSLFHMYSEFWAWAFATGIRGWYAYVEHRTQFYENNLKLNIT